MLHILSDKPYTLIVFYKYNDCFENKRLFLVIFKQLLDSEKLFIGFICTEYCEESVVLLDGYECVKIKSVIINRCALIDYH